MNINELELDEFDLDDLPEHASICLIGKRRSGKGVLTKDICFHHMRTRIDNVFLFSPTSEIANNMMDYVPVAFRYKELDIDVIERIMTRQEYLVRVDPKGRHNVLLIIDDIIASTNADQNKILRKLFVCARHFRISLIVSFQYLKGTFDPVMRENCDVVFLFNSNNFANKQIITEQYLNTSNNKNDGYGLVGKYAVGHQALVISNTNNSNDFDEYCFHYTADLIKRKFKLGKDY